MSGDWWSLTVTCCDDVLPDKNAEKQVILGELNEIYHSTIEPVESLYQYNVLGVDSFTGILSWFVRLY